MKAEEIRKKGGLVFSKIEEGFEKYENEVRSGSSEELYDLILSLVAQNDWENSYVDFYYGRLQNEEQERIQKFVPASMQDMLKQYEASQEIYYPLTNKLLELTWFLTSNEYLFSTYYFCKEPCTVWGNYDNTLVVFHGKKKEN